MDTERSRVGKLIAEEFPPEMQREAMAHIWKVYGAAWQIAREFDSAQRRKVYGHYRLALMEQSFKLFCGKHPSLIAEDVRPDGSSYDFFTIRSQSLIITPKMVSLPGTLPKKCPFRDTLASGTQYEAFEDVQTVNGRKFFHVLILHNYERRLERDDETGEYRKVRVLSRPGFIELAVPERNGTEDIFRTSLFRDHVEAVRRLRGVAPEGIPDGAANKPKARPKKTDISETEGA